MSTLSWVNLALAVGFGAAAAVVEFHASEGGLDPLFFVAISPFAVAACAAVWYRRERGASVALLVAIALIAGLLGLEVHDYFMSTSSTAGLTFLVIPVLQWLVLALGLGAFFANPLRGQWKA